MSRPQFTRSGARSAVIILLGSFAVLWVWFLLTGAVAPPGQDIERMRLAALRLRAGEGLYTNVGDPNLFYTWGPLLGWIWLPLTFLPAAVVDAVWMTICLGSWAASLWPARRSPALLLLGPLTLYGAWVGNVQAPMIAMLVATIRGRWGPVGVGIAASLKLSPILFALVWARNGEWRKVWIAAGVALLLVAPALVNGIDRYPLILDPQLSPRAVSLPLWIAVTLAASGAVFLSRAGGRRWLSGAVAVITSRPSLLLYDVGYLLVPLAVLDRGIHRSDPKDPPE